MYFARLIVRKHGRLINWAIGRSVVGCDGSSVPGRRCAALITCAIDRLVDGKSELRYIAALADWYFGREVHALVDW